MSIQAGAADQYANVTILNTDGTAKTDVTHSTSGLAIKYQRNNGSIVTLVAASMLAGGVHVDGGIYHVGDGSYKIGLPDAAVSAVGLLRVWTELADTKSIADSIPVVAYNPNDASTIGPTPLSSSEVRTEVAAGLAAYDGPTKAELDAAVAPLALEASVVMVASYVDTEVSAIQAGVAANAAAIASVQSVVDDLPATEDVGDQVAVKLAEYDGPTKAELDAAVAPLALEASLAVVATYVDTEVSQIITTLGTLATPSDVRAEVDAGVAAYDGPTKAELDAAVAPLALEASVQTRLALSAQETTNLQHFLGVTTPNKTMNDCGVAGSGLTAEAVWQYLISGQAASELLVLAAAGGTGSAGEGTSFATTDIQNAALQPKSAEADGVKMEARSIDEMIKADEYARKTEAAKRPLGGIRITRTQSGGSTGRT